MTLAFSLLNIHMDYISLGLIVILIICIVIGAIRGFFKVLINLLESVLSLVVSILFARPVGMIIYKLGIFNGFEEKIANKMIATNEFFSQVITETNKTSVIEEGLEALKIPSMISPTIAKIGEKFIPLTNGTSIATYIVGALFVAISVTIAACLLFLLIRIAMFFLKKVADKLDKIKLIGAVNHLLGAALGVCNGILIVGLLIIVMSLLLMIPSLADPIGNVIKLNEEGTWTLAKFLYQINPLGIILKLIGLG